MSSKHFPLYGLVLVSVPFVACGGAEPTVSDGNTVAGSGGAATGGSAGNATGGSDPTGGSSGDSTGGTAGSAGSAGTGGTMQVKPARAINIDPPRFFPEGVAVSNSGRFYIGQAEPFVEHYGPIKITAEFQSSQTSGWQVFFGSGGQRSRRRSTRSVDVARQRHRKPRPDATLDVALAPLNLQEFRS